MAIAIDLTQPISVLGAVAVTGFAIPTLRYLVLRPGGHTKGGWGDDQRKPNGEGPGLYRDKDGVTTPEAQAIFSNRPGKVLSLLVAIVGCGIATALAVLGPRLSRIENHFAIQNWCALISHIAILFQAIAIAGCPDSVRAYYMGFYGVGMSWFVMIPTMLVATRFATLIYSASNVVFWLRIGVVSVCIIQMLSFCSLPRRPSVYNEKGVEINQWFT